MPDNDQSAEVKRIQAKLMRLGAWLGVVLGLACGAMPAHYHQICNVVTQALAGLSCGAGAPHP